VLENKTAIIGYGGHAYVVAESHLSNGNSLNYYTNIVQVEKNPYSLAYLGCETDPNFEGWDKNLAFILGIGDNNLRNKIAQLLLSKHQIIESVIDTNSIISKRANIGIGIFASKGVLVNAFSKIGDFTISLFTRSTNIFPFLGRIRRKIDSSCIVVSSIGLVLSL
jgi:hypothetical protein